MGRPTGSADLPLHGGRVPAWLASRMARLGRLIAETIVIEYGRDELLRRLSHPFWFQSFGAMMGMDWHSSGITTSVLGALRRGLAPAADECEIDRLLDREMSSCSLTVAQDEGEIADVGAGERAIDKRFSDEQERFLADHGPAVAWDELAPLGPIVARVWKIETDALPAKATAEPWYMPDQTQVLELSIKAPVAEGDAALDALLDLLDTLDLTVAAGQETKTRRALELLSPAGA